MAGTSTKVFVYEVMGRHAGWLAAAGGLAGDGSASAPPHIILFPEVAYDEARFLAEVKAVVARVGYCVVVVSEGLRDGSGRFVAEAGGKDAFGHSQRGGVGPALAAPVQDKLGMKVHWTAAEESRVGRGGVQTG